MLGGASTAAATSARRGRAEQHQPDHLDEAEHGERRGRGEAGGGEGAGERRARAAGPRATWISAWSVSHSEAKPLSGGTPAIAIDPTRKAPPVQGMRRSSPPIRSRSSEPTARSKAPAAEEQQRLEHRVVEDVQQRGGEGDRRPGRVALGGEEDRRAEAERDDADVLDRVEGEQALEVVLHERVEHAAQRRQQPQPEHHEARPQREPGAAHSKRTRISP